MLKRICGLAVLAVAVAMAGAQTKDHAKWVGTWATSPMATNGGWSVKLFANTTLREIVHISNGGAQVRVRFTQRLRRRSADAERCACGCKRGGWSDSRQARTIP